MPLVSVGNLTVGGTGKTPVVILLAHELHKQGKRVAILSRGYGRQTAGTNILVSDGVALKADWRSVGDEAILLAQKCPWAVVAVGKDRYRLGCWVLEHFVCDCFLLDDGFQHLSLQRDQDIVIFDATDVEGLKGVLPAGRLREPLSAARWATTIIFSRMESVLSVDSLQAQIEKAIGNPISPVYLHTSPRNLLHIPTGRIRGFEGFQKKPVLLVSGIGNPSSFRYSVGGCGLEVKDEIRYPDHFAYRQTNVEAIRKKMSHLGLDMAITTEKDALKLREFLREDDPVWALDVEMTVTQGEAQIHNLLKEISRSIKKSTAKN
jgi:tetraacyldisaccharide 4'-kinase